MKQVIIIVDNGRDLYVERFDLNKISLDEMKELFGEFVRSKGGVKAVKCPLNKISLDEMKELFGELVRKQ
jgi:hypothetical protein